MWKRFGYVESEPLLGPASALPFAPITLQARDRSVQVSALIDSGATLNVLPYDVGIQLGADWEAQVAPIRLGGNLAESEARGLILSGRIGSGPTCLRVEPEQQHPGDSRPNELLPGV